MKDQLNKRFSRLYITSRDLHEALNYLGNVKLLRPGDVVKRGLLTAAVVSYVRPWSGNNSHPRANQAPEIPLAKILNKSLLDLHEHICSVRNKAVAHSDFEWNSCSWSAHFGKGSYATSGLFYDLLDGNIELESFDELAETVFSYVNERLRTLSEQLGAVVKPASRSL